jgi:hypothetical protein
MNAVTISLVAFACIFGSGLLGLLLNKILPEHHLSTKTRDAVILGAGLIATLTALVLGLLVSSSKGTFDTMNAELTQNGANIILLDHVMASYGQETKEIRDLMRRIVATRIEMIQGAGKGNQSGVLEAERQTGMEGVQDKLRRLEPQNEYQRFLHGQALQLAGNIVQARWLMVEQAQNPLPTLFLVILVFWLVIFFLCFGLFAESNGTVIGILFVCCLSVCCAIFLVLEMSHPLQGMIRLSSAPLRAALDIISR